MHNKREGTHRDIALAKEFIPCSQDSRGPTTAIAVLICCKKEKRARAKPVPCLLN